MSTSDNDGSTSGITPPGTYGVWGDSKNNYGVVGTSSGPAGVYGESIYGTDSGYGGIGVRGVNTKEHGVGVYGKGGYGYKGTGVIGSGTAAGVRGESSVTGVVGEGDLHGVRGNGGNAGVFAENQTSAHTARLATATLAGDFFGDVYVSGSINKSAVRFLLDHPLDPANKYLSHSSVESSDQKNLYDGIVMLDRKGEAQVELPEWFTALNRDFRYQLTCIGEHAAVFVAQEIEDNRFRISGGRAGQKVCWQVTGIRQDPWANANPLVVEEEKPENERGTYLHPELYGQPEEKSVQRALYPQPTEPPVPPELPPDFKDLEPQEE